MNLALGTNEQLLKSWDYVTTKYKSEEYVSNLTVTSHRIISCKTSKNLIDYQEIPLNSVKTIRCYREKKSNGGPISAIVFGVIFILLAIALFVLPMLNLDILDAQYNLAFYIAGGVLVLAGIIMIAVGANHLNRGMFLLQIIAVGLGVTPIEISVRSTNAKFDRAPEDSLIGKINIPVIDDICESLGAEVVSYNMA